MIDLLNENIPLIALVGRNGEGKSYNLNSILHEKPNHSLYISEEGIVKIIYQRNHIKVDFENQTYIYSDDESRGKNVKAETSQINQDSMEIIRFCSDICNRLEGIINKSQGQAKIQNIMKIFLSYNLNNIKVILIDEPENFLDEEYLKVISNFIKLLIENDYIIRIATHNSLLLSLINIDIDNIAVFNNRQILNLSIEDIIMIFQSTAMSIEKERSDLRLNEDPSIKYKLNLFNIDDVFLHFLKSKIKSIEFYRSLFYKYIIIVEGISDFEAINSIKHNFDDSVYVFVADGKAFIPFYTELFKSLGKKLIILIDSDISQQNHSTAITNILAGFTNSDIKVVHHNPDMEREHGIDCESIANYLAMTNSVRDRNRGWLKQLSAFIHFQSERHQQVLITKLFHSEPELYDFE